MDDISENSDLDDMAASMGFSSFGAQKPKKRKFNPKLDAAVDSSTTTTTNKVVVGSGGNSMPLGKSRGLGGYAGRKDDNTQEQEGFGSAGLGSGGVMGERELRRGDDDRLDDGGSLREMEMEGGGLSGSMVGGSRQEEDDMSVQQTSMVPVLDGSGGQRLASSKSPPNHQQEHVLQQQQQWQSQNIPPSKPTLSGIHPSLPSISPAPPTTQLPSSSSSQAAAAAEQATTTATSKTPEDPQSEPHHQHPLSRQEAALLRRGVYDSNGDIAYYDASFVEDPWKALEEKIRAREMSSEA